MDIFKMLSDIAAVIKKPSGTAVEAKKSDPPAAPHRAELNRDIHLTFSEAQRAGFQFHYSRRKDSAVITSIHVKSKEIIIPAYIDGHPVGRIANYCRCIIDPGIDSAVLVLPNTLTAIGDQAFRAFRAIEVIASNPKSKRQTYWPPILTEIYFPEDCVQIGVYAFLGQTKLKSLHFGRRTYLEAGAFDRCTALEEVKLKSCVLGDECFRGCTTLSRVSWEKAEHCGNRVFFETPFEKSCAMLFTGDVLQKVNTDDKTVTVPQGTAVIGEEAFKNRKSLERVILPPSVTRINRNAFAGCEKLWDIDLTNVRLIYDGAFTDCGSLDSRVRIGADTVFHGYPFKWTALEKESITDDGIVINGVLLGGRPVFSGNVWEISPDVRIVAGGVFSYKLDCLLSRAGGVEVIFPESVVKVQNVELFFNAKRLTFRNLEVCISGSKHFHHNVTLSFVTENGRSDIPLIYPKRTGNNPAYEKAHALYKRVLDGEFNVDIYDSEILETGLPMNDLIDIACKRLKGGYRLLDSNRTRYEDYMKLHIRRALSYAEAQGDEETAEFLRGLSGR